MNKKKGEAHVRALDGLRGCAALAVVMFHGILHFNTALIDRVLYQPIANVHGASDWVAKVLLAIFNGESAVILFFVLSGYVLGASLDRSLDRASSSVTASFDFLVRRAGRIYPAMFAAMGLYWMFSLALQGSGIVYPLVNAGIALRSATLYEITVHGPSWSLLVELFAAPFVLLFVLLRRRFGLFAMAFAACYAMFAIDSPVLVGHLANLWPYLISFVIGVAIASPQIASVRFEPKPAHLAWALAAFMFARHGVHRASISGLIAHSVLAGLVVFTASRASTGGAYRFLTSRPVQFLGRVSYSFYLLNVPLLCLIWEVISARVPDSSAHYLLWGLASGLVASIATLPLAALSERFVERPGVRLTGRLLKVGQREVVQQVVARESEPHA
jgi:peptidoglycan/LPS O-acetylase OafA/YrhL